jgi:hypothetical protein
MTACIVNGAQKQSRASEMGLKGRLERLARLYEPDDPATQAQWDEILRVHAFTRVWLRAYRSALAAFDELIDVYHIRPDDRPYLPWGWFLIDLRAMLAHHLGEERLFALADAVNEMEN